MAAEASPGNELFRLMFENHRSVMLVIDPGSGAIVEANRAAAAFYGYPREVLRAMNIREINQSGSENIRRSMDDTIRGLSSYFIFPHKLADGQIRTVEVHSSSIAVGESTVLFSIVHDLTAACQAEDSLIHQNSLYAALSETNKSIVRISEPQLLFREICRIAVQYGGFLVAWIGLVDPETKRVEPVAHAGEASGYVDGIIVSVLPEERESWGPVGTACREGRHVICNDIVSDAIMIPWRERAVDMGIRALAAFPLRRGGTVVGAYAVYAGEKDFFTGPLIDLLDAMALDISYALDNIEREAQSKRDQEALRDYAKRLELATTSGHLGVWDWDVKNDRMLWNERMFEIYDIPADVFQGGLDAWYMVLHPDDRAQALKTLEAAIRGEQEYETEYRVVHAEGSVKHVKSNGLVLRDADGHAVRMIGLNKDITSSKMAADRLIAYRKIIECSTDMVCMIDRDYGVLLANEAFLGYLAKGQDEVVGHSLDEVLGELSFAEMKPSFDDCFRGYPVRFEKQHLFPHAGMRELAVSCSPIGDTHGVGRIACVMNDITERRHLEKQLLHSQKMEAIGTLAGGVAHDFNNVLTVIMGYANLIKMTIKDDPVVMRMSDEIMSSVERGSTMTQRLLAFSRKQPLELRPLNVNDIVRGLEKSLGRLIGEDIRFIVHMSDHSLYVMMDKGQIEQILINLAVNARDAMPSGGQLLITTGRVRVTADTTGFYGVQQPGRYATVAVSDSGTGIEREIQKRIFDPFFTTKEVGKGTGLGLSMVYGIVKTHNGYITMDSEPGLGTKFTIYLPLMELSPREEAADADETPPSGTETVLLVEDDESIRQMAASLLENFGYRVHAVANGEAAVALFRERGDSVDLVVTDVVMPGLNGWDTCEEIMKMRPDVPTIFMSGYPADVIAEKGIAKDTFNYISKPLYPATFLKKIREVLSGRASLCGERSAPTE